MMMDKVWKGFPRRCGVWKKSIASGVYWKVEGR